MVRRLSKALFFAYLLAAGLNPAQAQIRFTETGAPNSKYVSFQAPASIPANLQWILPSSDGSANQCLATNGSGTLVWRSSASSNSLDASDGSPTNALYVDANGNVGIGTTSPSVALDVVGDIEYTGTITDVSDRRLKENIQPLNIGLDILRQLPVYSYTMKNDPKKKVEYGVMAQDLRELVPNLTSVIDPVNGYIGVNYIGLIPWSIRAIQEVDRDVASVKAQNEDLKTRVEKLEEQNRILSEQVQKLIELHQQSGH